MAEPRRANRVAHGWSPSRSPRVRRALRAGWVAAAALWWLQALPGAAITMGQIDDFEDETLGGWAYAAPTQLVVATTGGPAGAGDAYLELTTDGISSPGGRPVVTNDSQWAGDYGAAGVTGIRADLSNGGSDSLWIRIGFQGTGATQYVSSVAIELPADGNWYGLSFSLDPADFTLVDVGDGSTFAEVLASVDRLRFLSATTPTWNGDFVATVLGIDNIEAVPEPAAWLLAALGLGLVARRGRRAA